MQTWPEITRHTQAALRFTTDKECAEYFGVPRQTWATWKDDTAGVIPDAKSLIRVAEKILEKWHDGSGPFQPRSIDDISLLAWARQTVDLQSRTAYFAHPPLYILANDSKFTEIFVAGLTGAAAMSGAYGAATSGALVGSVLGPMGVALGAAIGAAGGYLAVTMAKQNARAKREEIGNKLKVLNTQIGESYRASFDKMLTSLVALEDEFKIQQKLWKDEMSKLESEASSFIGSDAEDYIAKAKDKLDALPGPMAWLGLNAEPLRALVNSPKHTE